RIAARAEDLLFELPYERARWLAAEIDRYVFREKVTLTAHDTDRAALLLAGPATETTLATLGLGLPTALWGWGPGRIGDVSCDVTRADWFGDTPAVTIWVATDDLAQALDQVIEAAREHGGDIVDHDAFEACRVAAGRPRFPHDLDEDT